MNKSPAHKAGLKKIVMLGAITFAVLLPVGLWVAIDLYRFSKTPSDINGTAEVIEIKRGQSFDEVCKTLFDAGLISSRYRFKRLASLKGLDKQIKTGEYDLSPAMSPAGILSVLKNGSVKLYKLTIPEGFNLHQVADRIERLGLTTKQAFLAAASDPDLIGKQGIDGATFEGYLFPDTYHFPKKTTAERIIATMVRRFHEVFLPEWQTRASRLGFSVHQIITLASIIEKETGKATERPIISSVFHNRLEKGMRLQTDPTVIYGIKDFDGNLTRSHLNDPTPYNTYKKKGLPPGPIAAPGMDSIQAALYPAKTDYLYFVSKKDGTHHFSTNVKAHNRAVAEYQLRRR